MKRRKVIHAGRLVLACAYTMIYPNDPAHVRREKSKCSSAARQRMNLRRSAQKLELLLAANFSTSDLVITLTYADEHLPETHEAANKLLKKYLRQLRAYRRAHGGELKYIYVTEGLHGDKRIHHHLIISGTERDLETLQSLWRYGEINLERIDARFNGHAALAQYLTKEPRNGDRSLNGKRCWTPSLNLEKPIVENDLIPDDLTLSVPPGATVLDNENQRNEFGEFVYIKYLLPASAPCKSRPRGRKRE